MVYYLRPSSNVSHSSMKPRYSLGVRESGLSYSMDSQPSQSQQDDFLQHLTAYLVIAVITAAITAVVIKFVVKPDANCVSYLTDKDDNGNVKGLSPLKVTGVSLLAGLLVAGSTALVHQLSLQYK